VKGGTGGGLSDDAGSMSPSRSPVRKMTMAGGAGADEEDKESGDGSSSEDDGKGGVTIKGASQYLAYQPKDKKAGDKAKSVNEERYFKNILKLEPQIDKGNHLKHLKNKLFNEFKHKYKNNNNAFLND
jgi:hypothetical protein